MEVQVALVIRGLFICKFADKWVKKLKAARLHLYNPQCSLSMHLAKTKVKTGVQNMIAELLPNGTCLMALNMERRRSPPSIPCITVRARTPTGPRNIWAGPAPARLPL
jgi:hypothetical protein